MSTVGKKAQCIFDVFDLRFGMNREEVGRLMTLDEESQVVGEALERAGAEKVAMFFDHEGRLWQVKATYLVEGHDEAEALLDRMSKDFRFQTATVRIAFELNEQTQGPDRLRVRYTELNYKRMYIHHMMAVGAAKREEAEELAKAIKEKEEEEYIPSGPLIF